MNKFDYIIVGGGLAGTVLALSLIKENKKVVIIDEPSLSSSSKVAAGLFQPMTFKRTVETWKGEESIKSAMLFYQWVEGFLSDSFFYPLPMYRMFSSFEEQNNWSLKISDERFSSLIGDEKNEEADSCDSKFGYGSVKLAGYLDVQKFLHSSFDFFRKMNLLLEEKVNYDSISILENEISYKNIFAHQMIFCEGWLMKDNPWFSYIPMKPVKGEVMTIDISDKKFSAIISSGLFSVPRKEGGYRIGSNYNWKELDEVPTEEMKSSFLNEISEILNTKNIAVKNHLAGIRPASHDRRPIIGCHPQYENLYLLNGLGARGVALAPFTADFLVKNLIADREFPPEMNVNRFAKYFHSS
jgi:glycine/D-amino acid oxidase-like deaminating enzyme